MTAPTANASTGTEVAPKQWRYEMAFSTPERADLQRRVGDLLLETGERASMADVIRRALWPDGSPE